MNTLNWQSSHKQTTKLKKKNACGFLVKCAICDNVQGKGFYLGNRLEGIKKCVHKHKTPSLSVSWTLDVALYI